MQLEMIALGRMGASMVSRLLQGGHQCVVFDTRRGNILRTPGRDKVPGTVEEGYLHSGPAGAGHLVKMVHNGIEYALMAAYLRRAQYSTPCQRRQEQPDCRWRNAPTQPGTLSIRLQSKRRCRGLASWQRDRFVAAGPDPHRTIRAARSLQVLGPSVRLWGGPLDYYRGHRRRGSRSGLERRALPAVRIERRRRIRRQVALRHAI